MRLPLAPLLLLAVLAVAGCGGGDKASVEDQEFIVELELPLDQNLEEPDVYGQVGLTPNGRNGTRVVIRLDEPFKSTMEAFIRRGGCSGFRGGSYLDPDFPLPDVKDGTLEAEVDAPTRELRMGYALVVREPLTKEQLDAAARDRDRSLGELEKGVCGDLTSADRVDEF